LTGDDENLRASTAEEDESKRTLGEVVRWDLGLVTETSVLRKDWRVREFMVTRMCTDLLSHDGYS
jgi:hypothetical protein